MKKRINILFLIFIGLISFSSFNVSAKSTINPITFDSKMAVISDSINSNSVVAVISSLKDNKECKGILGDPENDPDSVAWFLVNILNYLRLLGPLMVLVLSSLDFAKAILTSDDESLKKAQSSLITRLILAALLFVLPTLIEVILDIFGFTSSDICIFNWGGMQK